MKAKGLFFVFFAITYFTSNSADGFKLFKVRSQLVFEKFTERGARVRSELKSDDLRHLLPVTSSDSGTTQDGN